MWQEFSAPYHRYVELCLFSKDQSEGVYECSVGDAEDRGVNIVMFANRWEVWIRVVMVRDKVTVI